MKKLVLFLFFCSFSLVVTFAESHPWGWASVNAEGVDGVTGGEGGTVVTVSTPAQLEYYAMRNEAYIILVSGRINITPMGKDIRVGANTTIIGKDSDAEVNGGVLAVESTNNVIIRNLIIADTVTDDWDGKDNDYDGIRIRRSHHIWVDHCTIRRHGDGAIDVVNGSRYVTISNCLFEMHNKTMLIGGGDGETFDVDNPHSVTLYHNWFKGTTQRHPRVRFGKVHVFNNYYSDMGKYGRDMGYTTFFGYAIGYGVDSKIISQFNYFENVNSPTNGFDNAGQPAYITDEGSVFVNSGHFHQQTTGTAWNPGDKYYFETMPSNEVKGYVMANAGAGNIDVEYENGDNGGIEIDGELRGSGELIEELIVEELGHAESWSVESSFSVGELAFGDREYTLLSVPDELNGKEWVRTAMNSRTVTYLNRYAYISLKNDGVVYIVHPDRVSTKPAWLSEYENTGLSVSIFESASVTRTLTVYKKNVVAGEEVDRGINSDGGTTSNLVYLVVVDDDVPSSISVENLSIGELTLVHHSNGVQVYYEVNSPGHVNLGIYDLNGRLVRVITNQTMMAGEYSALLDNGSLPGGFYVVKLQTGDLVMQEKLILR